jgi:hypothetical protein
LKICEQLQEDIDRKASEQQNMSTAYVNTETSERGKSSGRTLVKNKTVTNLKNDREKSTKGGSKLNKSSLNITTDNHNTTTVKEPKTPGRELKKNPTVAHFNKTPLKHQPKTPAADDKKEESKNVYNYRNFKEELNSR